MGFGAAEIAGVSLVQRPIFAIAFRLRIRERASRRGQGDYRDCLQHSCPLIALRHRAILASPRLTCPELSSLGGNGGNWRDEFCSEVATPGGLEPPTFSLELLLYPLSYGAVAPIDARAFDIMGVPAAPKALG